MTVTAPLTSADCDLTDFAFMPLDVARLRDSELASNETPEACWAAVLLWAASWHQVPAASIPNDDRWIAKQAGYVARGKVAREWPEIKPGALRGFVECTDGRLYHPVVAEKAREAWTAKLQQRHQTECARIKKHNDRHGTSIPRPDFVEWVSLGCPQGQPLPVPRDRPPPSPPCPPKSDSKGQGEGQGQGQGEKEKETYPLPLVGGSGPAPNAAPAAPPPPFDGTNAETLNGKAVVTLAVGFELPEDWGIDAEKLGWQQSEVLREAEKYRQYFTSGRGKGTRRSVKGWRQSWSNWLGKAERDKR